MSPVAVSLLSLAAACNNDQPTEEVPTPVAPSVDPLIRKLTKDVYVNKELTRATEDIRSEAVRLAHTPAVRWFCTQDEEGHVRLRDLSAEFFERVVYPHQESCQKAADIRNAGTQPVEPAKEEGN